MQAFLAPERALDHVTRALSFVWQILAIPFHSGRLAAIRIGAQTRLYAEEAALLHDRRLLEACRAELKRMEALVGNSDLRLAHSRRLLARAYHLRAQAMIDRLAREPQPETVEA